MLIQATTSVPVLCYKNQQKEPKKSLNNFMTTPRWKYIAFGLHLASSNHPSDHHPHQPCTIYKQEITTVPRSLQAFQTCIKQRKQFNRHQLPEKSEYNHVPARTEVGFQLRPFSFQRLCQLQVTYKPSHARMKQFKSFQ